MRFADQDAEFWPKLCSETRSSRIADRSRDGPPLPAENETPRARRYLPSPPRTYFREIQGEPLIENQENRFVQILFGALENAHRLAAFNGNHIIGQCFDLPRLWRIARVLQLKQAPLREPDGF